MKKLMVVSQLVAVMVLAAVSCISAADVCIHVPDDLALNMCVQYQNNYYTGTFRYSPVQNLPDGIFYWKLDAGTFKPTIDTGNCFPVSNTLDMNICGEYHATEYQFAFKYAPTGTDTESSLNWKIDSGTFKQRAVVGCIDTSNENEGPTSVEQLDGSTFLFVVKQEIEESVMDSFTIDDSLYVVVENGDEYTVSFSDDHSNVSINPGDLLGSLESEENGILQYVIDDGFFAGGRFVIWIEDSQFHAELTVYGSGVPIIASVKGSLTEAE